MTEEQGYADGRPEHQRGSTAKTKRLTWTRVGIVLMVASALLWVPLPIVPFLPLSTGAKAGLGGGLVVAAEIVFWAGAALAGPEAVRRTRSWIRTTFRRGGQTE